RKDCRTASQFFAARLSAPGQPPRIPCGHQAETVARRSSAGPPRAGTRKHPVLHWRDALTGHDYRLSQETARHVRGHLAGLLADLLCGKEGDLAEAAHAAGAFWSRDYYDLLFPLRFGLRHSQ